MTTEYFHLFTVKTEFSEPDSESKSKTVDYQPFWNASLITKKYIQYFLLDDITYANGFLIKAKIVSLGFVSKPTCTRFCPKIFDYSVKKGSGYISTVKSPDDGKVITVVDARMGRGKSSAAIRYMNQHKGTKRFLYITPYLTEVDRICERCDFDQPDSDFMSKSLELKYHLKNGHNVAATHSLFYLMDDEALEMVRTLKYTLIIDESVNAISKVAVTPKDLNLILEQFTTEDENGILHWKDSEYTGKFDGYKEIADVGSLYHIDSALFNVLSPALLKAFDEVFMLTYMFDGQYQKGYLDYFGFRYRVVGIEDDDIGYRFSDCEDAPPPIDYRSIINVVGSPKMNDTGRDMYALSAAWYARRGRDHDDIKKLRRHMSTFFDKICASGDTNARLWTCFKEHKDKLIDSRGRYRKNFLQISARATNEYRKCTDLAYMANRFADPNITKFFARKNIAIDVDKFALSEMLQWIWRSAIRDGRAINVYIPSQRMRELLTGWIEEISKGADVNEEK